MVAQLVEQSLQIAEDLGFESHPFDVLTFYTILM